MVRRMGMGGAISLVVCALFVATNVTAESILWNTVVQRTLVPGGGGDQPLFLSNPAVSITYGADATDTATGASVCGTSIKRGTKVRFRFKSHVTEDIYWNGTGHNWDSPYGRWIAGAGAPASCGVQDHFYTYQSQEGYGYFHWYAPLSVSPPAHTLSGTSSFSCESPMADGSVDCTATRTGQANVSFAFGATDGRFYRGFNRGYTELKAAEKARWTHLRDWDPSPSDCQLDGAGALHVGSPPFYAVTGAGGVQVQRTKNVSPAPFTLPVPAQTIYCPITVSDGDDSDAPLFTSLSAGACVVGTKQTISIAGADPQDDDIRYSVDWDANGTVDQWLPATGFVPSGSVLTASRTYASAGAKAVDVTVWDEHGNASATQSVVFNCAESGGDLGGGDGGGDTGPAPTGIIRAIPSLVRGGATSVVSWSSENTASCTVRGTNGDAWSGTGSEGKTTSAIVEKTTYTLRCVGENGQEISVKATVSLIPTFLEL